MTISETAGRWISADEFAAAMICGPGRHFSSPMLGIDDAGEEIQVVAESNRDGVKWSQPAVKVFVENHERARDYLSRPLWMLVDESPEDVAALFASQTHYPLWAIVQQVEKKGSIAAVREQLTGRL